MLDFAKETLDGMTFLINAPVAFAGFGAVGFGRDDRRHATGFEGGDQRVTIVALAAAQGFGFFRGEFQQGLGLAGVAFLAARQDEAQREAQPVGDGVDFGVGTAPGASQSPGLRVAASRPRRAGVGRVDGGVDENGLQVRQMDAAIVERLPYAELAPARKPLEHGVPLAVCAWQQPPLCPATQYPQHGAKKGPALQLPTKTTRFTARFG